MLGRRHETAILDEAKLILGAGNRSQELQGILLAGYTPRSNYVASKGGTSNRWLIDATAGGTTCDGVSVRRIEDVVRFVANRMYTRAIITLPDVEGDPSTQVLLETIEEPDE